MGEMWWSVMEEEELVREMGEGRVFWGFEEGEVAFPPSFRWKAGRHAGDCCEVR